MAVDPVKARSGTRLALAAVLATTLAIPAEGLRQKAYYDPPGILTACYGHTGRDVSLGATYSLEQCKAWLTADMRGAIAQVDKCAPGLPVQALAAFGDAVYNLGPTIACGPSTAANRLRDYSRTKEPVFLGLACNELPRWDKAKLGGIHVTLPGLTKRRAAERELCMRAVQ